MAIALIERIELILSSFLCRPFRTCRLLIRPNCLLIRLSYASSFQRIFHLHLSGVFISFFTFINLDAETLPERDDIAETWDVLIPKTKTYASTSILGLHCRILATLGKQVSDSFS